MKKRVQKNRKIEKFLLTENRMYGTIFMLQECDFFVFLITTKAGDLYQGNGRENSQRGRSSAREHS